jgi:hypothetical protein
VDIATCRSGCAERSTSRFGVLIGCSITSGTTVDGAYEQLYGSDGATLQYAQLAGTRVFPVQAGFTVTYRLVCRTVSGIVAVSDSALTAVYTPGG